MNKMRGVLRNFSDDPIMTVENVVGFAWRNYVAWPVPAWRAAGVAKLTIGKTEIHFSARGINAPLATYREMHLSRWERGIVGVVARLAARTKVAFDIGAWVGLYSILTALNMKPGGRVIAFEPDPVARSELDRNLHLNNCQNVSVVAAAISDKPGNALFGSAWLGRSGSRMVAKEEDVLMKISVRTLPLDVYCSEARVWPDLIKIDVEGAEDKVFTGGKRAIAGSRYVILELHPHLMNEPEEAVPRMLDACWAANKLVLGPDGTLVETAESKVVQQRTHLLAISRDNMSLVDDIRNTLRLLRES